MKRGNLGQTAISIGWVYNALNSKMEEYGIEAEEYKRRRKHSIDKIKKHI